jgi:hypothetical protein
VPHPIDPFGNNVAFQTDQNVNPGDPLIQGMQQYGSEFVIADHSNAGPSGCVMPLR